MSGEGTNKLPALSDAALRETIDTMGLLIASMSNRVDDQGRILERLTQTAAETRAAAFAPQKATDWTGRSRCFGGNAGAHSLLLRRWSW